MSESEGELSLGCGIGILCAVFVPMFLVSFVGLIFGADSIFRQQQLLEGAEEVSATIISSELSWTTNGTQSASTYRPEIQFEYRPDAETLKSSTVVPGKEAGDHAWADAIVRRFPAGAQVTAWYVPADPGSAYLVHKWQMQPYLTTISAAAFAAFSVVFPISFFHPWPALRFRTAIVTSAVYGLLAVTLMLHYFDVSGDRLLTFANAAIFALTLIPAVVSLLLAVLWKKKSRRM